MFVHGDNFPDTDGSSDSDAHLYVAPSSREYGGWFYVTLQEGNTKVAGWFRNDNLPSLIEKLTSIMNGETPDGS